MHPLFPYRISIAWEVTPLEISAEGLVEAQCQKCETPLDVHQPDESQPNQLLATCPHCGAWHAIECDPDGSQALMFNMPGVDFVRAKLAAKRETAEAAQPASPRKPKSDSGGHVA